MQRQNSFNSRPPSSRLPVRNRSNSAGRISGRTTPVSKLLFPSNSMNMRTRSAERRMKRKDGRPIADKTWQAENVAKVQKYFRDNDACNLLNNGSTLKPMNLKMFVNLVNFIFCRIHPSLATLTNANYTDLLPTILNKWEYPGTISSSLLKTANTMHSWPHILALLSWLIDVEEILGVPCDIEQMYPIYEDTPIEDKLKLYKSRIISEMFVLWNSGQATGEYLAQHKKKLENLLGISDEEIAELAEQNKECNRECASYEEKAQQINAEIKLAETKQASLKEDLKNRRADIEQYKILCEELKHEHNETKISIEKMKEEIELKKQRVHFLKDKLSKQVVTVKDRDKIIEEINEQKRIKASRMKTKEHKQKISNKKDLKLSQLKKNLVEKISDYNLRLIEPSLNYPELKELCVPEDGFMRNDIKLALQEKIKKANFLIEKTTEENNKNNNDLKIIAAEIEEIRNKIKNGEENLKKSMKSKQVLQEEFSTFTDMCKKEKDILVALLHEQEYDCGLHEAELNLETEEKKLQEFKEILKQKQDQYKEFGEKQINFFKRITATIQAQRYPIQEVMKNTTIAIKEELKRYDVNKQ